MTELKITIDQLKNYLGTGLKSYQMFDGIPLTREMDNLNMVNYLDGSTNSKLMFYRLSDLDKFIPELGFVPIEQIKILSLGSLPRSLDFEWMYFHQINQLFQWHFWPFGEEYFEQGMVIDKLKFRT